MSEKNQEHAREEAMLKNLELWNSVCKTDPDKTRRFNRRGFEGTTVTPLYVIQKVTAQWGPIGFDWGFEEVERVIELGVWFSKVRVWYRRSLVREGAEGVAEIFQWGGTEFAGTRNSGAAFLDDEAAKKSITDGLIKALTYLGFAADVHMGYHDDIKYIQSLRQEKAARRAARPAPQFGKPAGQPEPPNEQPEAQFEPQEQAPPENQDAPAAPESSVESLQSILTNLGLPALDGITYCIYQADDGQKYIYAEGDTRNKKSLLKEAGFMWSTDPKGWFLRAAQ
jgi:hypothetical protein